MASSGFWRLEFTMSDPGRDERGDAPPCAGRLRRVGPAPFLLAGALLLLALALSGGASAHHFNAACPTDNSAFNRTWENLSGGPYVLDGQFEYWDDCILVRSDILLVENATARFHDVKVIFDNDLANLTIIMSNATVWEMTDLDRNPDTPNQGSVLGVISPTNKTTSWFFDAPLNAGIYFNDTLIVGGGLAGQGLTNRSGLYFADLLDFGWNRVDHTAFGNGLMLINFTLARTITNYTVVGSGAGIGLYLNNVGNLSFLNLVARALASGVVIEGSQQLSFVNVITAVAATSMKATATLRLNITDITDFAHRVVGLEFERVTTMALLRVRLTPAQNNNSVFGIELDGCRNITLRDADVANHSNADLRIINNTQNLLVVNASFRGPGIAQPTARGISAVVPGDLFNPNNFTFLNVTISGRNEGAYLDGVVDAFFDNTSIVSSLSEGLSTVDTANIRFANGTIDSLNGLGARLDGSNITIETTSIRQHASTGVRVDDAGFKLDRVAFQFNNGGSVRSVGAVRLSPSSILSSSLASATGFDAVNITGSDQLLFTSLFVFNSTFQNLSAGGGTYGLRLSTFGRVEVVNNTFTGMPIAVLFAGRLVSTGNTHRLQGLSPTSVVVLFDNGRDLHVANESYINPPAAPLSTAVRAQSLVADAEFFNLRLPRAEFGVWISGVGLDQSTASVVISNVTVDAVRDGISVLGINKVTVVDVTVLRSVNAIAVVGSGDGETLSVSRVFLQASATAVSLTSDGGGQITATDITLNFTAGPPSTAVVVRAGAVVTLGRTTVDGVDFGFDITDSRQVFLTGQNFSRNRFGLALNRTTASILTMALNWTIDSPTVIRNTTLRFLGEVTVRGVPLTIDNSNISVYALPTDPNRLSRFFMEGPSTLTLVNGTRIRTEVASGTTVAPTHYTIQMSPSARFAATSAAPWPRILLDGLGDPTSTERSEQGILLQAQDTVVAHVNFNNTAYGLLADGINLTVTDCNFSGSLISPGVALTLWGRGTNYELRVLRVAVAEMDGIAVTSATVIVDQSSFDTAGRVVDLVNAEGVLGNLSVRQSSKVVWARLSSHAVVWSPTVVSFSTAYVAEGSSALEIYDAQMYAGSLLAQAGPGSSITFEDPVVDVARADGRGQQYNVAPAGGTVNVFWTLELAVCRLSDTAYVPGASIVVRDQFGTVRFNEVSGASGFAAPFHFNEYNAVGNSSTYYSPIDMTGTLNALVVRQSATSAFAPQLILCVDDVPPVIVLCVLPPPLNTTARDDWTLCGSAYDEHTALKTGFPCVSYNGGACVFYSNPFEVTVPLVEGKNTFKVEAQDLFGNVAVTWFNLTRDRTAPAIVSCTPGFTHVTAATPVALVCQLSGEAADARFSGVLATPTIDANQVLRASVALPEGPVSWQLSLSDAYGNYVIIEFSWKLDTEAPTIKLDGQAPVWTSDPVYPLAGTVASDAVSMTFNGATLPFPSFHFSPSWVLEEGANRANLTATDGVGNVGYLNVSIFRDRTTNCSITSPVEGVTVTTDRITITGLCDPDTTLEIGGMASIRPNADHTWSATVTLKNGFNAIPIRGTDTRNAILWDTEIHVNYVAGGPPGGDIGVLVLFALLAGGTFALAFFISRRPRTTKIEEAPKSLTASQKAPPRPKPGTQKLPETPEDQTYVPRLRPPPGPPPGQ